MKDRSTSHETRSAQARRTVRNRLAIAMLALLACGAFTGCKVEPRKTDAELGLTPQQARGRRVYESRCERCHDPYSSRGVHGPSLKGLGHRQYLPSGMPVNDDRLSDVIMLGKAKMPSFRDALSEQQLADLLAYLKTL